MKKNAIMFLQGLQIGGAVAIAIGFGLITNNTFLIPVWVLMIIIIGFLLFLFPSNNA